MALVCKAIKFALHVSENQKINQMFIDNSPEIAAKNRLCSDTYLVNNNVPLYSTLKRHGKPIRKFRRRFLGSISGLCVLVVSFANTIIIICVYCGP